MLLTRRGSRAGLLVMALLTAACAALPEGVSRAPADDESAAVLTLPSGRAVPVYPDDLDFTGRATLRWPNGREYAGDWLRGRPHGIGVEAEPDGTTYSGAWHDGVRHGQGELVMPDQSRYVGGFVDGERSGVGTLESADGVYHGEWQHDVPNGEGVFEGVDGARYEGDWQDGERFGFGTYTAADGTEYEGDWAWDEPHGFGRLQAMRGVAYSGEWQDGRQNGYGEAEGPPGLTYEGTWVEGQKQGFGREVRPDGSSYEGEWQDGKRQGQGRERFADGTVHEGTWEWNQPLGPGRRRDPVGIEITGLWNQDAVSSGLLRLPSGLEYAGPLFSRAGTVAAPPLLEWLQRAADTGDPYAQLMLGTAHLDLHRPPPDVAEARRWLGKAAEAGVAEAQYRLALTHQSVDDARAARLLLPAAAQGHAGANELLGDYFYSGIGVARSLERAIEHYERAVAAGSSTARNNLAWLLATASDARHRDGNRAVALIEPIALYLGEWQYLDTLAAAWAAAGNFEQAMAAAQQAVEAAGLDPVVEPDELAALERRLDLFRDQQPLVDTTP